MAETIQESLLNNLLKSRYPLTYYLSRQQKFIEVLSTTQINAKSTCFESGTRVIHKRKAPIPTVSNMSDNINSETSEFNDTQNGIISDQDYYTAYDQSPEIDVNFAQVFSERPLLKSVNQKML